MVKHVLSLITLGVALALQASAQSITITQADMPVSGDTLRYSDGSVTQNLVTLPVDTGTGQTWNFTTLRPTAQGIYAYKSAAAVNPLYITLGLAAYGLKIADTISFGALTATNLYDFYKRSSSKFSVFARGVSYSGLPLSARYTDEDEIYQFPLNYRRRDSSTFSVNFSVAGVGSLKQQGYRINKVMGSGSIITPYGTFNALLVRVYVNEVDTITSAQLPIPIPIPRSSIHYVWLANGQHAPILDITADSLAGIEQITAIRYRDMYRVILPDPPTPDFFAIRTQLSVGDSTFFVNLSTPTAVRNQWRIFQGADTTASPYARFTAGTTPTSRNPAVKFTAPGLYSVRLRATNAAASVDTIKPDYINVTVTATAGKLSADGLLTAWPNPAHGTIYFRTQAPSVRLYDATGRLVAQKAVLPGALESIQVSDLPKGMYTLRADKYAVRIVVE